MTIPASPAGDTSQNGEPAAESSIRKQVARLAREHAAGLRANGSPVGADTLQWFADLLDSLPDGHLTALSAREKR